MSYLEDAQKRVEKILNDECPYCDEFQSRIQELESLLKEAQSAKWARCTADCGFFQDNDPSGVCRCGHSDWITRVEKVLG